MPEAQIEESLWDGKGIAEGEIEERRFQRLHLSLLTPPILCRNVWRVGGCGMLGQSCIMAVDSYCGEMLSSNMK